MVLARPVLHIDLEQRHRCRVRCSTERVRGDQELHHERINLFSYTVKYTVGQLMTQIQHHKCFQSSGGWITWYSFHSIAPVTLFEGHSHPDRCAKGQLH